jgi:hypothetical protein
MSAESPARAVAFVERLFRSCTTAGPSSRSSRSGMSPQTAPGFGATFDAETAPRTSCCSPPSERVAFTAERDGSRGSITNRQPHCTETALEPSAPRNSMVLRSGRRVPS